MDSWALLSPGQRALAPSVLQEIPDRLAPQQPMTTRAGESFSAIQVATPMQSGETRVAVLANIEGGQLQIANMAPAFNPRPVLPAVAKREAFVLHPGPNLRGQPNVQQTPFGLAVPPQVASGAVLRQQQRVPGVLPSVASGQANLARLSKMQQQANIRLQTVVAGPSGQPVSVPRTPADSPSGTSAPSQMSPEAAKRKCKTFLSTLIRLASSQPMPTATNVRRLIQGLVDGSIPSADFTQRLERELNSSPQPRLVPFLRTSLPHLRHALLTKEFSIEGVNPPRTDISMSPAVTAGGSQLKACSSRSILSHPAPHLRGFRPRPLVTQVGNTARLQTVFVPPQMLPLARPSSSAAIAARGTSLLSPRYTGFASFPRALLPFNGIFQMGTDPTVIVTKERATVDKKLDDDINDVATMAGVSVVDESRHNIPSYPELLSGEGRSCPDYNFLFTKPLQKKIADTAAKYCINEIPEDVVALVSQATHERLRSLLEKLFVIAEHRQENVRADARFEVTQDVKAQLKFLEEIDVAEKRRHDDEEREMLHCALKSRSKREESLELRQKAKEMHKADVEKMLQNQTNITALNAIGPRKRRSNNSLAGTSSSSMIWTPPKLKKVHLRDVLFLLEQERGSCNSALVYKAYCK